MFVTMIIPMRDEEAHVARCLDSILAQIRERDDFEILCVDGASTDRTREIVLEYACRDKRIQLVDNPDKIVPRALNLGIARARGDFIMRLDCHSEYAPDYVDQCLAVLERTGADRVGGYLTTRPSRDTAVGRAIAAATSSRFGMGYGYRTPGPEREARGAVFGGWRRDVFDRFGLFDERLVRNQDIEMSSRIHKGGGKTVVSPHIRIIYYNRSTFRGLRQQSFINGLWNPYTIYLVGGGLRPRHFVPLAFVMSILFLGGLGFIWWPAWLILAVELALYTVVAIIVAATLAREARTYSVWIVLAFANLHVAYGVGSLWGFLTAPFRFGLRRQHQVGKAMDYSRDS